MAAKNAEQTKPDIQEKASTVKQQESVYTLEEFATNAEDIFGTGPECVFAALKEQGIAKCTKQKAIEIVRAFCRREVK